MNKKILILVIVIVAVVIVGVVFYIVIQGSRFAHLSVVSAPVATSTVESTSTFVATQFPIDIFNGGQELGNSFKASYVDTSTKASVSFEGVSGGYRTQLINVYANGKKVGQASGSEIIVVGFSPTGKFFAFKTIENVVPSTVYSDIQVVDLSTSTYNVKSIIAKVSSTPYSSDQYKPVFLSKYIETASWAKNDNLNVISYYLWPNMNDNKILYYRVSPAETWSYNLATGNSTLVSMVP